MRTAGVVERTPEETNLSANDPSFGDTSQQKKYGMIFGRLGENGWQCR